MGVFRTLCVTTKGLFSSFEPDTATSLVRTGLLDPPDYFRDSATVGSRPLRMVINKSMQPPATINALLLADLDDNSINPVR
jgi:hypothetical protein